MDIATVKTFLKSQIPPQARRASLLFAMQWAAADELRRLGSSDLEASARLAADRLRREAETLGAQPMGMAAVQTAAPTLMEQILRLLD